MGLDVKVSCWAVGLFYKRKLVGESPTGKQNVTFTNSGGYFNSDIEKVSTLYVAISVVCYFYCLLFHICCAEKV